MKLTINVPQKAYKYVFEATCVDYNKMCDLVLAQVKAGVESVPVAMLYNEPDTLCFNLQSEQERIKAIKTIRNLFRYEYFVGSDRLETTTLLWISDAKLIVEKFSLAGIQYLEFVR